MSIIDDLLSLKKRTAEKYALSERQFAEKIARGTALTSAERRQLEAAVEDGYIDPQHLAGVAEILRRYDAMLRTAVEAHANFLTAQAEKKAAADTLPGAKQRVKDLQEQIRAADKVTLRKGWKTQELETFVRENVATLGTVNVQTAITRAIQGDFTLKPEPEQREGTSV